MCCYFIKLKFVKCLKCGYFIKFYSHNYFQPYSINIVYRITGIVCGRSFANCLLCHSSLENFRDSGNLIYKNSGQDKKCKKTFVNASRFAKFMKLFFRGWFPLYGKPKLQYHIIIQYIFTTHNSYSNRLGCVTICAVGKCLVWMTISDVHMFI